jgi:hypothetical protein
MPDEENTPEIVVNAPIPESAVTPEDELPEALKEDLKNKRADVPAQPAHSPETQDYVEAQLAPIIAAVTALRDSVLALRDITIHGSGLIQYSSVLNAFDDGIAAVDDILRAV